MSTQNFKIHKIKKKSGKIRTVISPNPEFKAQLKGLVGRLTKNSEKLNNPAVVHGFSRFKSPVSMAQCHVGHAYTISMDLEDFFNFCTEEKLKGKVPQDILDICLISVEGNPKCAAQGLPTSPALSNIAACDLDKAILKFINKDKKQIIYSRYADDLTFSFDNLEYKDLILSQIPQIVSRSGFRINKNKTRFMPQKAGNRLVCGISVGEHGISATRAQKKRLRAINHKLKFQNTETLKYQHIGLSGWVKMTPPKQRNSNQEIVDNLQDEVKSLFKLWKLKKVNLQDREYVCNLTNNEFMITNDPVYVAGMSTFTTGWTSCMRVGFQRFKGVNFWIQNNVQIAGLLSNTTSIFAGVERRNLRARTILHVLENGERVHDRIYGNPQDIDILRKYLETEGIKSVRLFRNQKVKSVKNIKISPRPYFDSLTLKKDGLFT